MVRKRRLDATPTEVARVLLWSQSGDAHVETIREWDIKTSIFAQAMLEILSTGAAVMLNTSMGGNAVGIQIWEGDVRHPKRWVSGSIEFDEAMADICARAALIRAKD